MPYTHYGLALSVMFPVSQMLYIRKNTAYKKYPNAEFFLVHFLFFCFFAFSPNGGKYGPEITPYLDTFHVVESC